MSEGFNNDMINSENWFLFPMLSLAYVLIFFPDSILSTNQLFPLQKQFLFEQSLSIKFFIVKQYKRQAVSTTSLMNFSSIKIQAAQILIHPNDQGIKQFLALCMRQKNLQTHHGYLSQRILHAPSTTSPSASSKNIHSSFENFTKQTLNNRTNAEDIVLIHQQNFVLKEENRVLKRQLNFLRNQGIFRNNQNQEKKQINDLRSTIKKQANEIKDLKIRIEMLSKQCKVYEDIIDKMEAKISRLTHEKNKLQDSLNFSKTHEKVQKSKKKSELDKDSDFMLNELNSKVGEAFSKIAELEERMRKQNEEWLEWKKQWGRQKIYYVSRIRALQKLQQTAQRDEQGESYVKIS